MSLNFSKESLVNTSFNIRFFDFNKLALKSIRNINKILLSFYIVFISIVIYTSNWGVDPLHDGALFPTPVALAQGKILFKDIQNQYGILQGVLESIPIIFFGPYLIVQRITGSIIIIFISFLIFLCCKKITQTKNALSASIIYLALTPSWNYAITEDWPLARATWPNSYGVLFQLIFINIYLKYLKERHSILLFYCGIVLAISSFARVQFLLASVVIFVWTALVVPKKDKIKFILSYLFIYLAVLLILLSQGSLKFMYEQIFQALFDSGENSVSFPSPSWMFKWLVVLFFTSTIILLLLIKVNSSSIIVIILYPLALILNHIVYPNVKNKTGKFYSFIELVSREIILTPIAIIIMSITSYLVFMFTMNFKSSKKQPTYTREMITYSPIYLLCITSFFQLHNLNYAYMYNIFPIFLVVLSIIYKNNTSNLTLGSKKRNLSKTPKIILILAIFLSLTNFSIAATKNSNKFTAPILRFMQTHNSNTFTNIDQIALYMSNISNNAKVSNNCSYALFSVNQNGYISNSRYPWNLLNSKQIGMKALIDSKVSPDYYLFCSSKKYYHDENLTKSPNYVLAKRYVISKDEFLTIYSKKVV